MLTGRVTDRTTSAPVSHAIVRLNGWQMAITDIRETTRQSAARAGMTFVEADNYARDYRYVGGTPHNVHLTHQAGYSRRVDVCHRCADDTLCVNNMQDSPGLGPDYVCRSVRVVAPSAGVMTLEALSTTNGPPPLLQVEIVAGGNGPCCSECLENPTAIPVIAGTEVVAHVEMPFGSDTSHSFTLNTSM